MNLEVGSILTGKVTGIAKFGAFVALDGGGSGLVHISEVANAYINSVEEYLSVGQTVKVKVIAIDDAGRINLVVGTFCIEYLFITEIQKHTGLAVIQTDRIQSNIFCNNTEIMGETCRALLFFGSQSIIKLGECIERICRSGKISALQHVNTKTASCA